MKWFKHMADMSADVKIRRLIRKFGVEGYGLYNYIIELIVRKLDTDSPIPDLEESSTDIASDLNMDTVRVEEIMLFALQQGLFEQDEITGRLVAHKVYKFLDAATTRSPELKNMIKSYRERLSGTVPDNPRLSVPEQNRIEENRTEQSQAAETPEENVFTYRTEYPEDFERFCETYPSHVERSKAFPRWQHLQKMLVPAGRIIESAQNYAERVRAEGREDRYIMNAARFLYEGVWKDYLEPVAVVRPMRKSKHEEDTDALVRALTSGPDRW